RNATAKLMADETILSIRSILDRLRANEDNPVMRARRMVEHHVPPERRGPGWDRHWRELDAYLDLPGHWSPANRQDPEEQDNKG
ncbi:hypothetical protein, partial [Sphingobium sp.]|uniref:hypothetical protein n=1 Tax=Sphingobium sp. TaxID=1912891 RepID=UPI002BA11E18